MPCARPSARHRLHPRRAVSIDRTVVQSRALRSARERGELVRFELQLLARLPVLRGRSVSKRQELVHILARLSVDGTVRRQRVPVTVVIAIVANNVRILTIA